MLGRVLAADVILAAHPVEGAARAAPADEVEAGRLRLREIVPRRAVAGRADDDHRVGEPRGDEVGAESVGIFLKADEQVEASRRGRGGAAAEQREMEGVDRAAILDRAADGDERARPAAYQATRRCVAVARNGVVDGKGVAGP